MSTRQNWKFVYHTPMWVAAPLRFDREGNTKPGFLCIHELENGSGLCGSTWFERVSDPHCCIVKLRGRWNVSRPCYDKIHRCPGWAGGGWKRAKHYYCRNGRLDINYEDRRWKWKVHRCQSCGVVVLPYMVRWVEWRSWWYKIRW